MTHTSTTADTIAHETGLGVGTNDTGSGGNAARRGCGMRKRRWSLPEIAVVVGGFIVFWPLGLAALGVKLFKGELWRGSADHYAPWKDRTADDIMSAAGKWRHDKWGHDWSRSSSGNAAFDEYRKAQLEKLEAERRKLEQEQKAFADYVAKLRRAKDQDEFDRFMAERNTEPKVG
jgi:hypothetical protein